MKPSKKNILVAPLNWGLGHATRCIPIIKALEKNGFTPIIASDGEALELLKKEFPHLQTEELLSSKVKYSKYGALLKWKIILQIPIMLRAIRKERKLTKKLVEKYQLTGIISDNRYGVYSKKVPSVFITHQLNVLSEGTTKISSSLNWFKIKKFKEIWVPDFTLAPNLSSEMGHKEETQDKIKYIGPLSRFHKKELPKKYDLLVLISGPEPQRSLLEEKLKSEILRYEGEVLFVSGLIEEKQKVTRIKNTTYYNYMTTSQLEQAFNETDVVLSRSGYSTVMDLVQLNKKAFFIPTPGQYEQEYLAKKFKKEARAPYEVQSKFKIEKLMEIDFYKGFYFRKKPIDWKELFQVFDSFVKK